VDTIKEKNMVWTPTGGLADVLSKQRGNISENQRRRYEDALWKYSSASVVENRNGNRKLGAQQQSSEDGKNTSDSDVCVVGGRAFEDKCGE